MHERKLFVVGCVKKAVLSYGFLSQREDTTTWKNVLHSFEASRRPLEAKSLERVYYMGVRRRFSKEGQKFPGGGQEPIFCLKNNKKILFFSQKSKKSRPGSKSPPCPPPLRTPIGVWRGYALVSLSSFKSLYL